MANKTYSEKLKDPRWQKKRLEILSRDNFKCTDCFEGSKTLHVHHLHYIRGNDPWDYPDNYLTTLCFECHERIEESKKEHQDEILKAANLSCKTTFAKKLLASFLESYDDVEYILFLLCELYDDPNGVKEVLTKMFNDRAENKIGFSPVLSNDPGRED